MQAAQGSFNPNLINYQMGPAQNVSAMGVGTQNFGQGAADYYMSPFAQAAIDPALREARLQGDLQKQAGMLGSIGRGTFGGARQALLQAEQERGTQRTMSDIQATGMEKAYQNAQAQFQADQARQLQAQQANQQYGLQAQLANQQAGLTTGQQNLAALLGVQQLGTQTGAQFGLANLSNAQQANVQNLAAQLGVQDLGTKEGLRASLANQAAQQEAAKQNLLADQQRQQLESAQSLEAQKANQLAELEASKQRASVAAGLGSLGANQTSAGVARQAADIDRLKTLGAYGDLERAVAQQEIDARYQDVLRKAGFSAEQIGNLSNILRGVPVSDVAKSETVTTPNPSFASQLAGVGLGGLSLFNMLGRGQ